LYRIANTLSASVGTVDILTHSQVSQFLVRWRRHREATLRLKEGVNLLNLSYEHAVLYR